MKGCKKKGWQALCTILLALTLLIACSAPALAVDTIQVTVSIENSTVDGTTVTDYSGWTGYLPTLPSSELHDNAITAVQAVTVNLVAGSTMMDAIEAALQAAGYSENATSGSANYCGASSGYLWSIGGLDSGVLGSYSGWLGALNNTLPNLGFDYVYLEENDAVRVLYSNASGSAADPSISWGAYNTSGGFTCDPGILSLYSDSWGYNYLTLTLPDSATEVTVSDTPAASEDEVRIYRYDSGTYSTDFSTTYTVNEAIPLTELGTSFDALYIVTDNGALDGYCINLRYAGTVPLTTLGANTAAALASPVGNWQVVATQAYGGVSLNHAAVSAYVNSSVAYLLDADSTASSAGLHVIALTALGYDVSDITFNGLTYDGFDKLYELVTANETAWGGWTELYAYPLMALLNATDSSNYATEINALIAKLAPGQSGDWYSWGNYSYDSAGIALAALSLAAEKGFTVSSAVTDGLIDLLQGAVQADGTLQALDYGLTPAAYVSNAESTAMGILGLDAAGEDVSAITAAGGSDSLQNGLLLYALGNNSGFNHTGGAYNNTASLQGLLALAAIAGDGASNVFDFQGNGTYAIVINSSSGDIEYDVDFRVYDAENDLVTSSARVKVYDSEGDLVAASGSGLYSLPLGSYTYIVSYSGHTTKSGSFTVTADQTITVRLARDGIEVTFRLIGDDEHGANGHTAYLTWYATRDYVVDEDSTVYDVLKIALDDAGLAYTWKNGYLSAVESPLTGEKLAEQENGKNSGWMYVVDKKAPSIGMDDYELEDGDDIIVYFTDDYTKTYTGFSVKDSDPSKSTLKTTLKKAIEAAEDDLAAVKISANGLDVPPTKYWLTQSAYDDLAKAIKAAQKVYDKSNADFDDLSEAIGDLAEALAEFRDARKAGLLYQTVLFNDVPANYWANNYIADLVARGIFTGKSATLFAPADAVTRAEFVAILARLSGDSLPVYSGGFSDVPAGAYYASAVSWAVANGITNGTSAYAFSPNAAISRQDMAVMLARYADYLDFDLPELYAAVNFADSGAIRYYATAAVGQMQRAGIINGRLYNLFAPDANATRAEAAKMVWVLDDLIQ